MTAGPTGPPPSCVPKSPWTAFVSQICELDRKRLVEPEALTLRVDELLPRLEREVVPLADADLGGVARESRGDRVRDHRDRDQDGEQRDDRRDEAHQATDGGGHDVPRRGTSVDSSA